MVQLDDDLRLAWMYDSALPCHGHPPNVEGMVACTAVVFAVQRFGASCGLIRQNRNRSGNGGFHLL